MGSLPHPLGCFHALRSSRCIPYSITIVQWRRRVWCGVVPAACLPHFRAEEALQISLVGLRSKVLVETAVRQIDAVR